VAAVAAVAAVAEYRLPRDASSEVGGQLASGWQESYALESYALESYALESYALVMTIRRCVRISRPLCYRSVHTERGSVGGARAEG